VHASVAALKLLQRPEEVAARRGLPIEDVAPAGMLKARRESDALASAALQNSGAREANQISGAKP
jgi:small subunit ribosomal protein S5